MTLPRKSRIPRARFAKIRGKRAFFAFGSLVYSPSSVFSGAVVVSKKSFPSSVVRHRVKRRVSATLEGLVRKNKIKAAVIVYPNARILDATPVELKNSLEKALLFE